MAAVPFSTQPNNPYVWKSADGKERPICSMADDHLLNTIAKIARVVPNVLERPRQYERLIFEAHKRNLNPFRSLQHQSGDKVVEGSELGEQGMPSSYDEPWTYNESKKKEQRSMRHTLYTIAVTRTGGAQTRLENVFLPQVSENGFMEFRSPTDGSTNALVTALKLSTVEDYTIESTTVVEEKKLEIPAAKVTKGSPSSQRDSDF